ncbi:MBL fold metallo-hydrolase [Phytoactinopolyspora mesophila]|nr:MBL fold metallo-hydrolase [Phytoactinopolyspora mesophila]
MTHELCVIGCSACAPTTLGPASGYLVRVEQTTLLVDCGPGVIGRLASSGDLADVDAVLVTHEHLDHCGDLMTLAFRRAFPQRLEPIPLYGPAALARVIEGFDQVFGIPTLPELRTPLNDQLPFTPIDLGAGLSIGDIRVETLGAAHPVPTLSLRFPDLDLVYTSDTGLTEELVEFTAGTSTLLAEATYVNEEGRDFTAHGHMGGAEAGELAARAGVELLVLTHLSDPDDEQPTCDAARSRFTGSIEFARPGMRLGRAGSRARVMARED